MHAASASDLLASIMGRALYFWILRWVVRLLAVGVTLAMSVLFVGDVAAQQASPSAGPTPKAAAPPPPTKKPHGKYFEVTLCTYPDGIPKGLVRWARTENGSLFTTTVGAFWDALPEGATVFFYDPEGPACGGRVPSPKPKTTAKEPGVPFAPPSDGRSKDGPPNRAGGEARKKAERAATAEAERKKKEAKEAEARKREEAIAAEERKRKEAEEAEERKREEAEERKREEAEEAEERKREKADAKAEAEAKAKKGRAEREEEEAHRQRNSPEAQWARGDAVLPPGSQYGLPKACEPPKKGTVQTARPGFKCTQEGLLWIETPIEPLREPTAPTVPPPPPPEASSLPTACPPPPGGTAPMRSLGVECTQEINSFPPPPPLPPLEEEKLPRVPSSRDGPTPMVGACGECKPEGSAPGDKKAEGNKTAQELAFAAALAQAKMNEELLADGSANGIIGGKAKDGFDSPAAQVIASATAIVIETITAAGLFDKLLRDAIKKGSRIIIQKTSAVAEKAAEELAKRYGPYIADALAKNGTIGPYRLLRKFTERLGGAWQAHHILEVKWFKRWPFGDPDLGPAVILTKAEHDAITAELRSAMSGADSPEKVWKAYLDVYGKKHPEWLEAIRAYFNK